MYNIEADSKYVIKQHREDSQDPKIFELDDEGIVAIKLSVHKDDHL